MVFVAAMSIVAMPAGAAFTAPPTLNAWDEALYTKLGTAVKSNVCAPLPLTALPNWNAVPVTLNDGAEMAAYMVAVPLVKFMLGAVRANGALSVPPALLNPNGP
jgi:hypothetical protein